MPDFTTFQIKSDAPNTAVGRLATQRHAFVPKPIVFLSKTLTSSVKNYSAYDHYLLAIVTYCKPWRTYIDEQWTVVIIDYKPLIYPYT